MGPNARGLVQHGGPPGWRRVTQLGVILYVMNSPLPPALADHNICHGLGLIYY
jgi:hypothetical protein